MYTPFLHTHNLFRWLIILLFILALVFAVIGWMGKKTWNKRDNLIGVLLSVFMDIQLLIGLGLYIFLSPLTKAAFADFGTAMKNPGLRFFAVEHIVIMLVAVLLVHIGRVKTKKAKADWKKHRASAIWYGIAFFILLHGIPWDRALI